MLRPRERAGHRIELRSVLVGHLRRVDENYQIDRLLVFSYQARPLMWNYGVHMQSEKITGLHDLEECFSSAHVEQIADADDQGSTSAHVLCRVVGGCGPILQSDQDCLATARELRPQH